MSGTPRSLKWAADNGGILTANGCRSMAVVVLGLLSAAAAIVALRGLSGALESSLVPGALLTAGSLVVATGVVVRLGWFWPPANRIDRHDLAVMSVASLAVIALGGGLCLPPDTPSAPMWILGVLIVAEESGAWTWYCWFRQEGLESFSAIESVIESPVGEGNSSAPFFPAAEVVQQLTRSRGADGAEELSGWLRLPFAAGQRTGSVHVAFCPPLCVTPELEVEQVEGPVARIKTAQLLPYGARFDLKLAVEAEESTDVLLQFSARANCEG